MPTSNSQIAFETTVFSTSTAVAIKVASQGWRDILNREFVKGISKIVAATTGVSLALHFIIPNNLTFLTTFGILLPTNLAGPALVKGIEYVYTKAEPGATQFIKSKVIPAAKYTYSKVEAATSDFMRTRVVPVASRCLEQFSMTLVGRRVEGLGIELGRILHLPRERRA